MQTHMQKKPSIPSTDMTDTNKLTLFMDKRMQIMEN